jgi:tetratricopeptide (TPR) repeat protein
LVDAYVEFRLPEAVKVADQMAKDSHVDRATAEDHVGIAHFNAGRLDEAIVWFERAIAGKDALLQAHAHLGSVYLLGKKDYRAAARHFELAARSGEDLAASFVGWGDALAALEEFDGAFDKYQRALRFDPRYADALIAWGDALSSNGEGKRAIEKYEQAVEINSNPADAYVSMGDIYWNKGEWTDALQMYERAITTNPHSMLAFQRQGDVLSKLGLTEGAIKSYRSAAGVPSHLAPKYYQRGTSLRSVVPKSAARETQTKSGNLNSLSNSNGDPQYLALIAIAQHELLTNEEKSAAAYCDAVSFAPDLAASTYISWGNGFLAASRPKVYEATLKYQDAIRIADGEMLACSAALSNVRSGSRQAAAASQNSQKADAFAAWGNALLFETQPKLEQVLAKVKRSLEMDPENAWAHFVWASALTFREPVPIDEVEEHYAAATKLDRNYAEAYLRWGEALEFWGGENVPAVDIRQKYKTAIRIQPDYAEAYIRLAETIAKGNDVELPVEASDNFASAAKYAPAEAWPYLRWGDALRTKGDYPTAISKYLVAYGKEPRGDAGSKLGEAYYLWGNKLSGGSPPDYSSAIDKYALALRYAPKSELAYQEWCRALSLTNPPERLAAVSRCGIAVAINQNLAEAYFSLGVNYKELMEREKAIAAFRKYLELVPSGGQSDEARNHIVALEN